jgi:hypothetical protein
MYELNTTSCFMLFESFLISLVRKLKYSVEGVEPKKKVHEQSLLMLGAVEPGISI